MSYPTSLDDATDEALQAEVNQREKARREDKCSYCGAPARTGQSCRYPDRHNRPFGPSRLEELENTEETLSEVSEILQGGKMLAVPAAAQRERELADRYRRLKPKGHYLETTQEQDMEYIRSLMGGPGELISIPELVKMYEEYSGDMFASWMVCDGPESAFIFAGWLAEQKKRMNHILVTYAELYAGCLTIQGKVEFSKRMWLAMNSANATLAPSYPDPETYDE